MILFTDHMHQDMAAWLGTREPEAGGAAFGPTGADLVSLFVADEQAHVTATTYTPSNTLIARIPEIENKESVEFKGIVHSHPGSFRACPT